MKAMAMIGERYAVERDLRDADVADPEMAGATRADRSTPIMAWIASELACPEVLPKSPIGKALACTLGHHEQLERYLTDGRLAIDNSIAERAVRPVGLGRKNFPFADSPRGGKTMATLMNVVASARLHGLDPSAYLIDVIGGIAGAPTSRLDELLPDR